MENSAIVASFFFLYIEDVSLTDDTESSKSHYLLHNKGWNDDLTCFTGPFALCVWAVICCVLVNTHQPFITLSKIVPCSSTGLPLSSGADRAAAADTCGDAAFTLKLQRPPGGAVYLLTGRTVKVLKLLSWSRGWFLWPHCPQRDTQKEQHPHYQST